MGGETDRWALLIIPYTDDSATLGSSLPEFSIQVNIYINNMVCLRDGMFTLIYFIGFDTTRWAFRPIPYPV